MYYMAEDSVSDVTSDSVVREQKIINFPNLKKDLERDIKKYGPIYKKLYRPFHDPAYRATIDPASKYPNALGVFRHIIARIKYILKRINSSKDNTEKSELYHEYVYELHGQLDGIYRSICQYPEGGPMCDQIETHTYTNMRERETQREQKY